MRHLLLILFCAIACSYTAQAQFAVGLRGGLHTQTKNPQDIFIGKDTLGVSDLKFGTQFGAWVRIGGGLFIQPELIFNANRTDFEFKSVEKAKEVLKEKYSTFDLPVMVGAKLGPVRLLGGPVGHVFLNSQSELFNIKGYQENWKRLTWGWQAGVGIGLGRFSADLRYEGNFNKFGDQITVFGDQYNFSNNPSRLVLGVNMRLFGK